MEVPSRPVLPVGRDRVHVVTLDRDGTFPYRRAGYPTFPAAHIYARTPRSMPIVTGITNPRPSGPPGDPGPRGRVGHLPRQRPAGTPRARRLAASPGHNRAAGTTGPA